MRVARGVLGALGVAVGLYGALLLWQRQSPDQVLTVAVWLIAGVLLHDVVVAGATLAAGWVVLRLVPRPARAPVAVGAVVLATVTLAAVPVLLAYGRKADNPTVLDRDYGTGWSLLAALVVAAVVVAVVVRVARERRAGRT